MEQINEEKSKLENIKDILDNLQESILENHLIQDNKYLFAFNEQLYRVRMPSQKEKSIADVVKNKLYLELVKEGSNYTRKQLKLLLKEKQNIDIEELEKTRNKLQEDLKVLYYELAEKLSDNIEAIEQFQEKIIKLKYDLKSLCIEIATYLMPSIEDRLEKVYIEQLTFSCTERLIKEENQEDKWIKVWKSLEEYQNESSGLEDRSASGMIALLVQVNS